MRGHAWAMRHGSDRLILVIRGEQTQDRTKKDTKAEEAMPSTRD